MTQPRSILKFLITILFLAGFSSAVSMRVQGSDGAPSEQWRELLRSHRLNFPARLCQEWNKLPSPLKNQATWDLSNECDPKNALRTWLSATILDPEFVPASKFKIDPLMRLSDLAAKWSLEPGPLGEGTDGEEDTKVVIKRMIDLANDQVVAALLNRKLGALQFEILDRLVTTVDCSHDKASWVALRPSFEELSWVEADQVLRLAEQKGCFQP